MKKKIIPIIITLAISFAAIIAISYWWLSDAWFAQNTRVVGNGMDLKTVVPLNIYITAEQDEDLYNNSQIDKEELNNYNFTDQHEVSHGEALYPASTPDGYTFWYATKVKSDGSAELDSNDIMFKKVDGTKKTSFYVEEVLYMITTSPVHDGKTSIDVYLKNLDIKSLGTNNELYKSVRISISAIDENEEVYSVIYRYAEDDQDTQGDAFPAENALGQMAIDPSLIMGEHDFEDPDNFSLKLPLAQDDTIYVKEVIIRLWFEGNNPHAIYPFAGGGFGFDIEFEVHDSQAGD